MNKLLTLAISAVISFGAVSSFADDAKTPEMQPKKVEATKMNDGNKELQAAKKVERAARRAEWKARKAEREARRGEWEARKDESQARKDEHQAKEENRY